MLNFIYYPVSFILWVWHKAFGYVFGEASGIAWALAVVFLVFTLRAILYKPFVGQVRSMRKMQEFQPEIAKLRKKYSNDRQKQAEEMQKLQKEHGVNPVAGCLPVLVQVPVFIGLFHVLREFGPILPNGAPRTENYFFDATGVESFNDANLFGAKLGAWVTQGEAALRALPGGGTTVVNMLIVMIPLMIAAGIFTHITARHSVARQTAAQGENPQTAIMNKLMLYVFPIGVVVGAPFLPLAVLLYWVSNNLWTLGQQYVVYKRIDAEETTKKEQAAQSAGAGARGPVRSRYAPSRRPTSRRRSAPARSPSPASPPPRMAAPRTARLGWRRLVERIGEGGRRRRGPRGGTDRGLGQRRGERHRERGSEEHERRHGRCAAEWTQRWRSATRAAPAQASLTHEPSRSPRSAAAPVRAGPPGRTACERGDASCRRLRRTGPPRPRTSWCARATSRATTSSGCSTCWTTTGTSTWTSRPAVRSSASTAARTWRSSWASAALCSRRCRSSPGSRCSRRRATAAGLMLDIAGWRQARRDELTELGTRTAKDVLESGESVRLRPMTPFERKVVHDAVAGVKGVVERERGRGAAAAGRRLPRCLRARPVPRPKPMSRPPRRVPVR